MKQQIDTVTHKIGKRKILCFRLSKNYPGSSMYISLVSINFLISSDYLQGIYFNRELFCPRHKKR